MRRVPLIYVPIALLLGLLLGSMLKLEVNVVEDESPEP